MSPSAGRAPGPSRGSLPAPEPAAPDTLVLGRELAVLGAEYELETGTVHFFETLPM